MDGLIVISLCALLSGPACATTNQPSPRELVREAVATLSKEALGAERLDWLALESTLLAGLPEDATLAHAHARIGEAVAALNDPHARFVPPSPISPAPPPQSDSVQAPPAAPRDDRDRTIPPLPEGRMIERGIAYVVVPGCDAQDVNGLRQYARAAADVLATLQSSHPTGWILDLRLNGGGNIWPALLGFRPLLRDGVVMTMIRTGEGPSSFGIAPDHVWLGSADAPSPQLSWGEGGAPSIPEIEAPVAVLIDRWTMSSGEGLAIAWRTRPLVRFFGGPTGGLTTVTNIYHLADGSVLNLPVAQMGDARGRPVIGPIAPDQMAEMGDWPTVDDAAVRAAANWITSHAHDVPTPQPEKP